MTIMESYYSGLWMGIVEASEDYDPNDDTSIYGQDAWTYVLWRPLRTEQWGEYTQLAVHEDISEVTGDDGRNLPKWWWLCW